VSPGAFPIYSLKGNIGEDISLTLYGGYIGEYLSRSLTNDSDICNPINGLLMQLQRDCAQYFKEGFFFGSAS
jgi:hypothetical protein